jgi:arginyl-tRNA synthetase
MILPIHRQVHDAVAAAITRRFDLQEVPPFSVETPPSRALGDLAITVAFQLARSLRKAPRVIAQEIADAVGPLPGVERIVVAPNGYLNVFLDRAAFVAARAMAASRPKKEGPPAGRTAA